MTPIAKLMWQLGYWKHYKLHGLYEPDRRLFVVTCQEFCL